MRRMWKKQILLLLAVAVLLGAASCKSREEDVPDGMKIASAAGADYFLFVPEIWNLNTAYGVSGAYRDLSELSVISVGRYEVTDDLQAQMTAAGIGATAVPEGDETQAEAEERWLKARIGWFWENQCLPVLKGQAKDGAVTLGESSSVAPGGVKGMQYLASAQVDLGDGEAENVQSLRFLRLIVERTAPDTHTYFYVISFSATERMYEVCGSDLEAILTEFRFLDQPYVPDESALWTPAKIDAEKIPAGMQIACTDEVAYRFFVPAEGWEVDRNQTVFYGYRTDDRTNVSVVPYMPTTDGMTPEAFFAMSEQGMKKTADPGGYARIGEAQSVELGGKPAMKYEFSYTVSGNSYRYCQVIAKNRGMIYTVTYTAKPEHYEEHWSEFEAILGAFSFR